MKRYWAGLLVLPAALLALALASAAHAVPFQVGGTECGDLKKVRGTDGKVRWQLTGCQPLENLVGNGNSGTCGDGLLDPGEVCDPGEPEACNGVPSRCNNCLSCGTVGNPTPTPAPGATPTPPPVGSADCPQGELPPLGRAGFENWFGREGVSIGDGQTHTYCFTVTEDVNKLEFAVGDRTGALQCFWHTAEYLPPTGATGIRAPGPQTGRYTGYAFFSPLVPLPHGVWRVRITAANTPECNDKYQIYAHP